MSSKLFFIILIILLFLSFVICLMIGTEHISLGELLKILSQPPIGNKAHGSDVSTAYTIIWCLRLPRLLAALLIGAGLAATGCVLQGILRNPLAEPYTLGISGGAALGMTLVTVCHIQILFLTGPLAAFAGALLAVGLVYLLASRLYFSITGLILSGVILSFIFSSLVLLIFAVAQPVEVHSALMWLMGSLASIDTPQLKVVGVLIIIGIGILFLFGRDLDVMTLGDEKALHLGIEVKQTRRLLFIISSLIAGACVSITGIIGFVGLIIPHLVRLIIGPKHQPLILASVLAGAIFLMITDTIARSIIAPVELPVGVITGIIGGIFFIVLLLVRRGKEVFP